MSKYHTVLQNTSSAIRAVFGDRMVSADDFDFESCVQLHDYHQNLYHDSYFYALVLDKNGNYYWGEYASTAYSGQSFMFKKASLEQKQAYDDEMNAYFDRLRAERKSAEFKKLLKTARKAKKKLGITNTLRAKEAVRLIGCKRALALINGRSSFKKSLLSQVVKWIEVGSKYKYPLTANQLQFI